MNTYICSSCKGEFEKTSSDEDVNAEAEAIFGIADASSNADMAIICDDCFNRLQDADPWLKKQVDVFQSLKS